MNVYGRQWFYWEELYSCSKAVTFIPDSACFDMNPCNNGCEATLRGEQTEAEVEKGRTKMYPARLPGYA